MNKLILASNSPARQQMLAAAGLSFEVLPADLDERALDDGEEEALSVALRLARAKALHISQLRPQSLVIGADQTLALGAVRLHKPEDREQARQQLKKMAGRDHHLVSACALAQNGTCLRAFASEVVVTFRPFSDKFLEDYLERVGDQVLTSVGGYQIEGPGAQLIDKFDGDWPTVLGLPLFPLLEHLRELTFLPR